MDNSVLDGLVAGFYRAATGDIAWEQALDAVQVAFGARTALLQTMDLRTGHMLSLHSGGPDMDEALLSYVREFHRIDPRRRHAQQRGPAGLGTWVHCHEVFDDDFVAKDRFFQHYLLGYDTRYNANVAFPVEEGIVTGFILELPARRGVLTPDEREWARRAGVHMQDALRAHQRVRRLASQSLAGHRLLDGFAHPMWLIDADRFVHFANRPAQSEVAHATRVFQRGSHLQLSRRRDDVRLAERLQVLRDSQHGATAVVDLRDGADHAPVWLHLAVLRPDAALGVFGHRPMVLVTLFDARQGSLLDPFALSNLLQLTPAQAKVAARLAEWLSAEQIAAAQGMSVATVRTHTRRVLSRLGAQRVVDLVRSLRQGEALWAQAGIAGPDTGRAVDHGQG